MRSSAAAFALAFTVSSLAACAGAPPPPPAAPAPPPAPPPPPPPDLSAVPDPSGLVVSGSFAKLSASMGVVHGWTNLPMLQSEQVSELMTTEAIGPVVDLDQPVYFALTVVGSGLRMKPPLFAMSAAVKDPDKVKALLGDRYKLVPGENGTTFIEGLGKPQHKAAAEDDDDDDDDGAKPPASGSGGEDGDDDDHRTCELAPSFGDAPVRLVCGVTKKDMTTLGPWLTRTAPRTPATADLHVDVRLEPLKQTITEGKKLVSVMLGSVLGTKLHAAWAHDLALAVVGDLADLASDMDGTTLDFTLADSGATETASAQLSGSTSLLGRLAVAHPERNGAPPAAFWQLPADADAAFFTRGWDDSLTAHARELLTDALGGGLVQDGAKDTDAKAVATAFGKLLTGAPIVHASGMDLTALRKALADERSDGDAAAHVEAKHATAEVLLGWSVLGIEQPMAPLASAVKELAAGLSKPSLLAARRAQNKDAAPPVLRSAPVAKAAGLPAGTAHWVLELPQSVHHPRGDHGDRDGKKEAKKPAPALKPMLVHILLAPDGARTWVGFGGDEAVVGSKIAASLATSGNNLGGRPELASLKSASVGAAALLSARGVSLLPIRLGLALGGATFAASSALDDLDKMPDKGMTPLVVTSTAKAGGPPSVVTGNVTVPRSFIEDVVTSILRRGGL